DAPVLGALSALGTLFIGICRLYRLAWRWTGPSLLPQLDFGFDVLDERRFRLTLTIPRADRGSPQLVRLTRGALRALPRFLGSPAQPRVDMELRGRRAVYLVYAPAPAPVRTRLRRLAHRLLAGRRAVAELERQAAELQASLRELRRANDVAAMQAA